MKLLISKYLSLPSDLVTQVEVILAKRRAGKSYTMRRIAEQLLKDKQQVVMVDPKGDQWGIRSSADGKKPGYPVLILGGEHGDLPLEVGGGELVARLVVEERVSALLDLSQFRKHEIATFMTAFLENLYRLKAQEKYRTPMKLIVDEADAIAPQKPQKGEERMLGAIEDIVRRGGQRGIGCTLVTQRSAVLNKNVLTQAQMLVVLRTIAPQDIAAMKAWIDVHGTAEQGKELIESLPSLPIGDAWFWSPGWPTEEGIFKRVHVLPIETFDSGATPKPGQRRIVPKNLADVNLDALKTQMAATIEKAKNDDPKVLRKRILELESAAKNPGKAPFDQKIVDNAVKQAENRLITQHEQSKKKLFASLFKSHGDMKRALESLGKTLGEDVVITSTPVRIEIQKPISPKVARSEQVERPSVHIPQEMDGERTLSKGARQILSYLHGAYPNWKSKTQTWVATGYAPGGGFNNLIYELTGAGLIEKDSKGKYTAVRPVDPWLIDESFDASLDKWDSKLSAGARKILRMLLNDADLTFSKEVIAGETGYALGGGFNNLIYELTGKELIIKVGTSYQINPEILDL